jgi:hypothetical protein
MLALHTKERNLTISLSDETLQNHLISFLHVNNEQG